MIHLCIQEKSFCTCSVLLWFTFLPQLFYFFNQVLTTVSNHSGTVLQDAPKLLTPNDGVSPGCLFLSNTEHQLIGLTKLQEPESKTANQIKRKHQGNLENSVHIRAPM